MNEADSQVDIFPLQSPSCYYIRYKTNWRVNKIEDEATSDIFSVVVCDVESEKKLNCKEKPEI